MTTVTKDFNQAIKLLQNQLGSHWVVGTPLGIGKPNPLINALYNHALSNPETQLEIFTALSLAIPSGKSLLERRFLQAFTRRFFGEYPELGYLSAVHNNTLPENITVREFYLQSGKFLRSSFAQRHYVSSNYTHVARDMVNTGVNVILQMVAVKRDPSGDRYSLSSNPDLTLDIIRVAEEKGLERPTIIAMVNENMPFMGGQAEVTDTFFDLIHDAEADYFEPFATPAQPINATDYSIGLLASTLIDDGGTLQIGIGSLADALVYCTQLRHQNNGTYLQLLETTGIKQRCGQLLKPTGNTEPFKTGLYAASEMFVEGFAHLYDAGVLKRKVYPDAAVQKLLNDGAITEQLGTDVIQTLLQHGVIDEHLTAKQCKRLQSLGILKATVSHQAGRLHDADGQQYSTDLTKMENVAAIEQHCLGTHLQQGALLHAAFFMGSKRFYAWLKGLTEQEQQWFQMTPVSQINELYGGEALDRVQRVKARFFNTCMKVDLLGAAAADTLENQQVVSGVGGQYNFVAMAHALADSRSVLMLRSVHIGSRSIESNIVWQYGYCTIPRHLRDLVITEYGIADLRGQADETCIQRLICVADSRFQHGLRQQAIAHGKLSATWQIPEAYRHNHPERIKAQLEQAQSQGYFPQHPFGEDFIEVEKTVIKALQWLKANTSNKYATLLTLIKAQFVRPGAKEKPYLKLLKLEPASTFKEKLSAQLLVYALRRL